MIKEYLLSYVQVAIKQDLVFLRKLWGFQMIPSTLHVSMNDILLSLEWNPLINESIQMMLMTCVVAFKSKLYNVGIGIRSLRVSG